MKIPILIIKNSLLLKNLSFVYWHIGGVLISLQAVVVIGGLAIAYFDKKPVWETMYLAFITALTIGYGDLTPQSVPSKVIAIVIGFVGIIVTGVVVAASLRALELTLSDQIKETGRSEKGELDQC
ncbi:MAG: ion channel [Desulforhopalus sp.]